MDSHPYSPRHLASGKSAETDDLIIQRRYRLVSELASFDGNVLLDFGCGNGAQTFLFAPHFSLIAGADVGEESLNILAEESKRKELGDRVFGIRYDGFKLPFATDSIDCAVSFEVLEHVESEDDALSELSRVIRPGGTLAMSVPNRWWIFETHGAALPLLPWNRVPFFGWLPKRFHDRYAHARIYERREVVAKVEHHGFTVSDSVYITAPMDVVKWAPLQTVLRKTIFRGDVTRIPFLSTAVLVTATRSC